MIGNMRPGSVIIDLAASTGGNTELTKDGETIEYNGVSITGNSNLPAAMPSDASKLYGKNVLSFLKLLINKDGVPGFNFQDELVEGACIVRGGRITNKRVIDFFNLGSRQKAGVE